MNLDAGTLDELVDLARQRGGVSMEDLRQWLPIERMTVEDISCVLARLDEEGFDLEIDPMMLLSAGGVAPEERISTPTREQTELPASGLKGAESGFRTSSGRSFAARQTARSREAAVSAPMLPWVLAFVIVVVVFFAAFAF
jgi:hypothetical protein